MEAVSLETYVDLDVSTLYRRKDNNLLLLKSSFFLLNHYKKCQEDKEYLQRQVDWCNRDIENLALSNMYIDAVIKVKNGT